MRGPPQAPFAFACMGPADGQEDIKVRVFKCVFRSGLGPRASLDRCFGIKVALLPVTRLGPCPIPPI